MLMVFLNLILGFVCFAAVIGILLFPILAIVSGIKESKKPLVEGQRRYSKTTLFVILTVVSFFALIAGLVGWGVLSYMFLQAPLFM